MPVDSIDDDRPSAAPLVELAAAGEAALPHGGEDVAVRDQRRVLRLAGGEGAQRPLYPGHIPGDDRPVGYAAYLKAVPREHDSGQQMDVPVDEAGVDVPPAEGDDTRAGRALDVERGYAPALHEHRAGDGALAVHGMYYRVRVQNIPHHSTLPTAMRR